MQMAIVSYIDVGLQDESFSEDGSDRDSSKANPTMSNGKRRATAQGGPPRKHAKGVFDYQLCPLIAPHIRPSLIGGPRIEIEYEQEVDSLPLVRSAQR